MRKIFVNLFALFMSVKLWWRNFRKNFKYRSRRNELFNLIGVDKKQYENDADELRHGLSPEEIEKVNHILQRMENVSQYNGGEYRLRDIYSAAEIKKFKAMNSIWSKVKYMGDYYQYKNFKLTKKTFEPSIFTDGYEINKLKTADKIRQDKELAIFDVGAYIGDSALILRDFFPDNRIYAFEAIPDFCKEIEKTILLNDLKKVVPVNLALGDHIGTIECSYDGHTGLTKVDTLDNYVHKNNIRVGLIKTDIEGAEWALLLGALETIREQKPTLIISIYHNYNDFFKIKPMIESLGLGYTFSFTDSCYGLFPIHEITLNCEMVE
ncbi:MAG: FkbM family methyltransferase [Planctomycetaceae bacterium]|jgi:FkbM family methyltransferase|nr:FkbM family methyltransferase [Planctomycetaceae bacterium]